MPERRLAVAGSRDWLVSRLGAGLASKVHIKATISHYWSLVHSLQFVTGNEEIKKMSTSIVHTVMATRP